MEATVFNPTQLHLLKMFSYAKTEDALLEIKKSSKCIFRPKGRK